MLEIYNETIRDLLENSSTLSRSDACPSGSAKRYQIKRDPHGHTYVTDLKMFDVRSCKEVSYLLDKATHSRSVGKTLMNEESSRSHFVFTLHIKGFCESSEQVHGVLNLVDLAGSVRLSRSEATGDRLKETVAINKSLSSLGDVIHALVKKKNKKEMHVPYRNSLLTHLLESGLGGNSKTLMLVNISPDAESVNESICSLRFASRANACERSVANVNVSEIGEGSRQSSQKRGGEAGRVDASASRQRIPRSYFK